MDTLFRRAGNLSLVVSQNTEFADVFVATGQDLERGTEM
jgi:hypothetical protein